jgi:hypothetical protein
VSLELGWTRFLDNEPSYDDHHTMHCKFTRAYSWSGMSMVAARVICADTRVPVGKFLESAAVIRAKCFMIARSPVDFQSCRSNRRSALPMKRMNKDWTPLEG